MPRLIVAALAVWLCLTATSVAAGEYKETDDLTFLGQVYKLVCSANKTTVLHKDKFMRTPLDTKGIATIIDLEKRTIRDHDLYISGPLRGEFKAIIWEGSFDRQITITSTYLEKTIRMIVYIEGSPSGIKGIEFAKTTQSTELQSLFLEWGRCRSLAPK